MTLAEDGEFAEQPPGAVKVLVADDNELVRDSFVELLRAEGYEVRTAADGVQAVELADQWRPQAVLLDIHMPRLSGLETARRLREAYPPSAMALLMMSGMTLNDAWLRHAKAAGFDDCVDKTSDPKLWLERLRAALPQH
jgi:CheY-like chemotaxis protein